LASATVDDLIPLKITFKRMQMLIDLARAIVEGTIDLDAWMRLDAAALYDKLCSLHGVGHWTAAVVVTRTKGIFQHIAHNDVALQAAVAHYFQTGKSAPDVLRIMGQYGEYGGLVAHFTLMRWVLDRYPLQTDFAL
jgi:DNA-3-methyladenine glycosylase II